MSNTSEINPPRQMQMQFLDRSKSSKHTKILENIMEKNLRKQSGSFHDLNIRQNHSARKMIDTSQNKTLNHQADSFYLSPGPKNTSNLPQQQTNTNKSKNYNFSIVLYLVEVILAYGLVIGISFLEKLTKFPFFLILSIFALAYSITPFKYSNLLALTAVIITIVNKFINMTPLSYPTILICYSSTALFNEKHKKKILFSLVIILQIICAFLILPSIYKSFPFGYFYAFPFLILILRSIANVIYWIIGYSNLTFIQLGFFITGIEIGTILCQFPNSITFWYLMVLYTLNIINERRHYTLRFLIRIINGFKQQKLVMRALPAQLSAYICIHSFHLLILVYIFSYLPIQLTPYSSSLSFSIYVNEPYKPIIVFLLGAIYQIMGIVSDKKQKKNLLFGSSQEKLKGVAIRIFMLVIGMWIFYVGFGIGAYIIS